MGRRKDRNQKNQAATLSRSTDRRLRRHLACLFADALPVVERSCALGRESRILDPEGLDCGPPEALEWSAPRGLQAGGLGALGPNGKLSSPAACACPRGY